MMMMTSMTDFLTAMVILNTVANLLNFVLLVSASKIYQKFQVTMNKLFNTYYDG